MVREAVIVALADPTERANAALFAEPLPPSPGRDVPGGGHVAGGL